MKDKIILVHYINVYGLVRQQIKEVVNDYYYCLPKNENEDHYVIPIEFGDSRIECIYPVMVSDKEAMERMEENLKKFNNMIESKILKDSI